MKKKITLTTHYDNGVKYTTVLANIDDSDHCWITDRAKKGAEKRINLIDGDYLKMAPRDAAVYGPCYVINRNDEAIQVIS